MSNKESSLSTLILKYEDQLEDDPRSRVFAPLAEAYRKVGLLDKALEVLRLGIRHNPDYSTGFLTLAACYKDMGQYNLAYSTLRPLAGINKDNYRFQKLFGDICLELNNTEEALDTFKYLLFLNPRDEETSQIVKNLEEKLEEPAIKKDKIFFDLEEIKTTPKDEEDLIDSWVKVDLGNQEGADSETSDQAGSWEVKKSHGQNDESSTERSTNIEEISLINEDVAEENSKVANPIITHTLVDLYLNQGYVDKAIEVLSKILAINPEDEKTKNRLDQLQRDRGINELELVDNNITTTTEDSGRESLMSLYDKTVATAEPTLIDDHTVDTLNKFSNLIKNRALELKNRH